MIWRKLIMDKANNIGYCCGVCGKSYGDVESRSKCEQICIKRKIEEAKRAAEAKKKEEQAARKAEVDKAYEQAHKLDEEATKAYQHAYALATAYAEDYGTYSYIDNIAPHNSNYLSKKIADFFLP